MSSEAGSSGARSRRDPALAESRKRARRLPTPPKKVIVSEDAEMVKALLGRIQGQWPQVQPHSQTYKEEPFEGYAKLFMTFAELGQQLKGRSLREVEGLPEIVVQRSVGDLHTRMDELMGFFDTFAGQVLRDGLVTNPGRVAAIYEGVQTFFKAYEGWDCELNDGASRLQNCMPALRPALQEIVSGWDVWVAIEK